MKPTELARECVASGFIPESMEGQASQALAKAYETKGQKEVEDKITFRMTRRPIRSMVIFNAILNELPDKPKEAGETKAQLTIAQEIELEKQDYAEAEEINTFFKSEFSKPYDPSFERNPSIFMATPYRDMPKDLQDKYKANTFISVKAEAEEANTSMREICRRKGIEYGLLLM